MQLKRRQDVQWRELPKIESPFFARAWAERNLNVNGYGFGLQWVQGLDDVIANDNEPHRRVWDQYAKERLLEKLEKAEVVLVHDLGSQPALPLVLRDGEGENASWRPDNYLDSRVRFNAECMITDALRTRGILAPLLVPVREKPKLEAVKEEPESDELKVINPRWEHADEAVAKQRKDNARIGDTVILTADVQTVSDGTRISFDIFDTSVEPPQRIAAVHGKVFDDIGTARWVVRDSRTNADTDLQLEFDGRVGDVRSERAEIPMVVNEFIFSF